MEGGSVSVWIRAFPINSMPRNFGGSKEQTVPDPLEICVMVRVTETIRKTTREAHRSGNDPAVQCRLRILRVDENLMQTAPNPIPK